MDLDYFETILKAIEYKNDKIKMIADYCLTNNVHNQYEISRILEKYFKQTNSPQIKTAIFFVISEIFIVSSQKNDQTFFRTLTQKAKSFLEQLSQVVTEFQMANAITIVIDRWAADEMFMPQFLDKLKLAAHSLYIRVQQQKQNSRSKFNKYKKTFLMELLDVKDFQPTSRIYNDYVQISQVANKINIFNNAYNKLELDANNPNEEMVKRAKELFKVAEGYSTQLEEIICGYHEDFRLLRTAAKEEIAKLDSEKS